MDRSEADSGPGWYPNCHLVSNRILFYFLIDAFQLRLENLQFDLVCLVFTNWYFLNRVE